MTYEHIEPDFESAAEAWMAIEMTKATMRYRHECIGIATEYERRRQAERELVDAWTWNITELGHVEINVHSPRRFTVLVSRRDLERMLSASETTRKVKALTAGSEVSDGS